MNDDFIYLDHSASTPLDERVLEAMLPYFGANFYNPSSPYAPAVYVKRDYEQAKAQIAECIGGKPDELIMTAGATESINMMFWSVKGHIITSAIEHPAVLEAAKLHDYTLVMPNKSGRIDPVSIKKSIKPTTVLVSVQLANNEIGTIQPLRDIAEIILSERLRRLEQGESTPIYLHCDASQGLGQIDVHVSRLGVDALTLNAGKVYGPKQVGCLWLKPQVRLDSFIRGGGQERGLRSGTENVAGVVGFAEAVQLAAIHMRSESKRLANLRDDLEQQLTKAFPQAVVSGARKKRLPGHLHISFPGLDAERLIFLLEAKKVLVATGSACSANKSTESHVLKAIGLKPNIIAGSLRITLGRLTNEANLKQALAIMVDVLKNEYKRVGL